MLIKEALNLGVGGHGCGHNMFGMASLGAVIAIKEMIEVGKIKGMVKFFGTFSEEKYFGKIWMVWVGLWDDVDVNISWHSGVNIEVDVQSSLVFVDFKVEFFGQAAYVSVDLWNGRSVLDVLEFYTTGINYYWEYVKPIVNWFYVFLVIIDSSCIEFQCV